NWDQLTAAGFRTVLDPMVIRCGDLFLKGAGGVQNTDEVWALLSANVHALGMFFDALLLHEKLPVFNYGSTFDFGLDFDERPFATVNENEDVLHDIDLAYPLRDEVKRAAIAEVRRIYEGPARVPHSLAHSVLSELAAAEYRWAPVLEELEQELRSDDE